MTILAPMVSRRAKRVFWADSTENSQTIQGKDANNYTKDIIKLFNKPPRWNDQIQAFSLNFNERVDLASVKNF